jgi:hypothetical protein
MSLIVTRNVLMLEIRYNYVQLFNAFSDNQITKHLIVKLLNTLEYKDFYEGGY